MQGFPPIQRFLLVLRSNWLSRAGAITTTLAFMGIISFFILSMFEIGGPYMGLITFLILPTVFVTGLLLIPAGLVLYRRTLKARMADLEQKPMGLLKVVGALTTVNVLVVGLAGYQGLHYMDSVEFCGTVCHDVMQPQYEAYLDSPHARVGCVECHIGPGASWFVKSKLSGVRQVFAVLLDTFQRPIPTPVHDLRPARDTCEQCHWPDRFEGDTLVYRHHFLSDRENTKKTNVLIVKTGGTRPDGKPTGVHWHVHEGVEVTYYAEDQKRTKIPWVRLSNRETGENEIFTVDGFEGEPDPKKLRTMDCLDCHNQPSHVYERAPTALNEAMASGAVSPKIPLIRKMGFEALTARWTSSEEAEEGIRRTLTAFYETEEPLDEETRALLEPAIVAIQGIWRRNIYPGMGIDWDTYRSFAGHIGCFRCHGGDHRTKEGREISTDCENCHVVLSYLEEDPPILESLGLGDD